MPEIVGYVDRLTVHPGEAVHVHVSTDQPEYRAELVRIVHGDVNPEGPGSKSIAVAAEFSGTYPGRQQETVPGSFATVPGSAALDRMESFTIGAWVWPSRPDRGELQGLVSRGDEDRGGFRLALDEAGRIELWLGASDGSNATITASEPCKTKAWIFVSATYDAAAGEATLFVESPTWPRQQLRESAAVGSLSLGAAGRPLVLAAASARELRGGMAADGCFDGKLEAPVLLPWAASAAECAAIGSGHRPGGALAAWAFEQGFAGATIVDRSPFGHHGTLHQMPARAMVGHAWDGRATCLTAPEQYGAIHFHADDMVDAGWDADFVATLPGDLPSGVYAIRASVDGDTDDIIFFVAPAHGATPGTDTAILFPTVSYLAYANERMLDNPKLENPGWLGLPIVKDRGDEILARHPEYGGSHYDSHLDGSGVCYSSSLRPVLNMRPDHRNWQTHAPRALSSDLYTVDWLEHLGVAHDALTDHLLHERGVELLRAYRVIITGTHPEYWTAPMRDALEQWLDEGGRLMYLGGNGFYWVTSLDPAQPHIAEVRRGISGTRTWESRAGELLHSTTGEPGGLWRYRGQDPNRLVGNGFAAQGFDVPSPGYAVLPGARDDDRVGWILEGVDEEVIGEYGLILGGVAADEIDRFDERWGSPPHAVVLATSKGRHSEFMQLVIEDIPVTEPNVRGNLSDDIRADLVFMETANGGAVFSVGSMAWTGALSHDGYDSGVSRLTRNVLERFRDETPIPDPPTVNRAVVG